MPASDLENAASQAVLAIRRLHDSIASAQAGMDKDLAHLSGVHPRLVQDANALKSAEDSYKEALSGLADQLTKDAEEALREIRRATSAVPDVVDQLRTALDHEVPTMDTQAHHLDEAGVRLKNASADVAKASRAAIDRAAEIEHALALEMTQVEQLLAKVATDLKDIAHDLEETATTMLLDLDGHCETTLAHAEEDLKEKAGEVTQMIEHTFTRLAAHSSEVGEYSGAKLVELVDEGMTALEADVKTVRGEFEELAHHLDGEKGNIELAGKTLTEHLAAETQEAETLDDELSTIRGQWATFGF